MPRLLKNANKVGGALTDANNDATPPSETIKAIGTLSVATVFKTVLSYVRNL